MTVIENTLHCDKSGGHRDKADGMDFKAHLIPSETPLVAA